MGSRKPPEESSKNSVKSKNSARMSNTVTEPLKAVSLASVSSVVPPAMVPKVEPAKGLPLNPLVTSKSMDEQYLSPKVGWGLRSPTESLPRNVVIRDYLVDGMFCDDCLNAGRCYRSSACQEAFMPMDSKDKERRPLKMERETGKARCNNKYCPNSKSFAIVIVDDIIATRCPFCGDTGTLLEGDDDREECGNDTTDTREKDS